MTEKAEELLLLKLEELAPGSENDKIRILEQSIVNGWQGIFPLSENNKGKNSGYKSNVDRAEEAAIAQRKYFERAFGSNSSNNKPS